MIIKIVGAGEDHFSNLYSKEENEYIIGVDGGLKVLNDLKIDIDVAIGDFDSFDFKDVKAKKTIKYNSQKDFSDLSLALQYAVKLDNQKIIIYNVTGGRLDHFYSVVNDLINYKKYNIEIIDNRNKIYLKDKTFTIAKDNYKYISFFAINDTVITLEGFEYPLRNYRLKRSDNLCLSNQIKDNMATVFVSKPILIIQSN